VLLNQAAQSTVFSFRTSCYDVQGNTSVAADRVLGATKDQRNPVAELDGNDILKACLIINEPEYESRW